MTESPLLQALDEQDDRVDLRLGSRRPRTIRHFLNPFKNGWVEDLGAAIARVLMGGLRAIGSGVLVFWDMQRLLSQRRLQRSD